MMRPNTIGTFAAGIITGSLITTTIVFAAPVRADVTDTQILTYAGPVCATLNSYPTVAGILGIGQAIMEDGYTAAESGQIVGSAIINVCPQHMPELKEFIRQYHHTTGATA